MDHKYALLPGFAGHATILRIVGQTAQCYRTEAHYERGRWGRVKLTPKGKVLRVVDTLDEALSLRAVAKLAYDGLDDEVQAAQRAYMDAFNRRKAAFLRALLNVEGDELQRLADSLSDEVML